MSLCIEKKLTLTGKIFLFECELLHLEKNFGLLKYVIDRSYEVSTLKLHSGDITYALYWTDRPYTLYIWRLQNGQVNYYFNIADSVSLSPKEFIWRDLAVDVLIDAEKNAQVLDEDELPENISPELSSFIEHGKRMIVRHYRRIIREADDILQGILAGRR